VKLEVGVVGEPRERLVLKEDFVDVVEEARQRRVLLGRQVNAERRARLADARRDGGGVEHRAIAAMFAADALEDFP
jgi:hypothetical protein